jgi:hypothetical protein
MKMYNYLVGIDGSNTPDPKYWMARNEFIRTSTPGRAKEIWIGMREGWLRSDEINYIQVRRVPDDVNGFASDYAFTSDGIERSV